MNNESGVNTVLLVVIVAILVGGVVWFFTRQETSTNEGAGINVTLPTTNVPAE